MLARPIVQPSAFQALLSGTPLEDCFAFWRARRAGRAVPLKSALDPVEMPQRILPYLFLYEVTPEGRFRCRLAGTAVCAAFQSDPTGRYLDEMIPAPVLEDRLRLFREAVERELPVVYTGTLAEPGRTWIKFKRLLTPMSIRGEHPDGIFGMVIFPELQRRRAGPRLIEEGAVELVAWATPEDLTDPDATS
ncbi:hypothetical protein GCM10011611_12370 [Aliidongia dinghuensis]|uniref:PAS domain-containing protein n=1 Tax=Aliidongia dinghuensis TaxID=1867774 RepID=A0A8J2YSC5_9PROT|nr:PAS domain-containing protein [Aliidongia dinghuensis]GGF08466.1 hypothetical protein GCM10011611_12370 [Aliidongia dinghuensis]